ncbi:metallophosphoesterase [Virgibacillus pantothenticus]|uniref:metallophosphoesterase n=1 Tax=Virgibacillus pantothenticus TaxID=1473 RepID=UPI00201485E1|nr:metallophosphoesterase [Virgibacillus pantothenticus]
MSNQQMKENQLSNRHNITKKKLMIPFAILFILSLCIKAYMDTNTFKVNKLPFYSDKIPDDKAVNILQITDVHNKVFGKSNEELIQTIKDLNADIIVITGDLIDRKTTEFNDMFAFVEKLTSVQKHVYFVTGNHEWDNPKKEEFLNGLEERQVTILNNKNRQLTINQVSLNLVGIDDSSTNHENVTQAFAGVNDEYYTVLLSHSPNIIEKESSLPADLILSGHTHGGQVRLPFIGALVAPDEGLFPTYDKGTYNINRDQFLYIDSGLGTSVAPIRFLNQSQISMIRVSKRY